VKIEQTGNAPERAKGCETSAKRMSKFDDGTYRGHRQERPHKEEQEVRDNLARPQYLPDFGCSHVVTLRFSCMTTNLIGKRVDFRVRAAPRDQLSA